MSVKTYMTEESMNTFAQKIALAIDKKYIKKTDVEQDEEITEEEVKKLWDSIE